MPFDVGPIQPRLTKNLHSATIRAEAALGTMGPHEVRGRDQPLVFSSMFGQELSSLSTFRTILYFAVGVIDVRSTGLGAHGSHPIAVEEREAHGSLHELGDATEADGLHQPLRK